MNQCQCVAPSTGKQCRNTVKKGSKSAYCYLHQECKKRVGTAAAAPAATTTMKRTPPKILPRPGRKTSPKAPSPPKKVPSPKAPSPKKPSPPKKVPSPTEVDQSALMQGQILKPSRTNKPMMKTVTSMEMPEGGCVVGKRGRRSTMEDSHVAVNFGNGINFYAIFDGHGGKQASALLADVLPAKIYAGLSTMKTLDDRKEIEQMIRDLYLSLDEEIITNYDWSDGSTAVAVLQIGDILYFINLGDSRAILVNSAHKVIYSTTDQKPSDPSEKARIEAAGGKVYKYGVDRVNGILAVSRAFGDKMEGLKITNGVYNGANSPVTANPVITAVELNAGKEYYLILACDGLWDVMKNEDVAEVTGIKEIKTLCSYLVDRAIDELGSNDNVSVMVATIKT
jgi:protein phosphatase PTC1